MGIVIPFIVVFGFWEFMMAFRARADDEFDVATATAVEETKEPAKIGFDYSTTMNGVQIFRKPKIFQKLVRY